jgi:hypothetical protein
MMLILKLMQYAKHKDWSMEVIHKQGQSKKAIASRNACILPETSSTLNMIVAKIKEEVSLWRFTRANAVTNVTL